MNPFTDLLAPPKQETEILGNFLNSLLSAYDFVIRHCHDKWRRWVLDNFGNFAAKGELFAVIKKNKIVAVAVGIPVVGENLEYDPSGDYLYVAYAMLHPKFRGIAQAKQITGEMWAAAKSAFPNLEFLLFNRAFRGDMRLRKWKIYGN